MICCFSSIISAQVIHQKTDAYASSYDCVTQCPRLVSWVLHSSDLGINTREKNWKFIADVPSQLAIARHGDYTNSGYHRGHLCPAADRSWSTIAMKRTFRMSNVAPQVPTLNVGTWKATENICRRWAMQYDSILVMAIPLFVHRDTTFIGQHNVAVPHAFIKIACVAATDSLLATWFYWNK